MSQISTGKVALILVCLFPLAVAFKAMSSRDNPVSPAAPQAPIEETTSQPSLVLSMPDPERDYPQAHQNLNFGSGYANKKVFLRAAADDPDLVRESVQTYRDACLCQPFEKAYILPGESPVVLDSMRRGFITYYISEYIENAMSETPISEDALLERTLRGQTQMAGAITSYGDGNYDTDAGYKRLARITKPDQYYAVETAQCVMVMAGAPMRGLESSLDQ